MQGAESTAWIIGRGIAAPLPGANEIKSRAPSFRRRSYRPYIRSRTMDLRTYDAKLSMDNDMSFQLLIIAIPQYTMSQDLLLSWYGRIMIQGP